jgi:phytoene synthase
MLPHEAQDSLTEQAPDFALACGFIPHHKREAVTTLYGFYAHLLATVRQARDPMLGEVRLQWWQDVFNGKRPLGEVQAHPMATHVLGLMAAHELPLHGLADMVDAVTDFLYTEPPSDVTALEFTYGRIYSALMRYASLILADGQESGPPSLAGPAGVAYGLTQALCEVSLMRRGAYLMIPARLFAQAGLEPEQFHGLKDGRIISERLLNPLHDLACQRLAEFRADFKNLPPPLRPAFAVMGLVRPRLARLEKTLHAKSYNPDQSFNDLGPLRQVLQLWQTAVFGRC